MGALIGVGIVNALGDDLDTVFKLLSIAMLSWALVKTWNKQRHSSEADKDKTNEGERIHHLWLPFRRWRGRCPFLRAWHWSRRHLCARPSTTSRPQPTHIHWLKFVHHDGRSARGHGGLAHHGARRPDGGTFLPTLVGLCLPILAYGGATGRAKFGIQHISQANIMKVFMALVAIVLLRYVVDIVPFSR